MLTRYLDTAMGRARYELMEDDEGWFATIPGFPGLYGSGETVEEARRDLRGALEGWIILALQDHDRLPVLDGLDLTPQSTPRVS